MLVMYYVLSISALHHANIRGTCYPCRWHCPDQRGRIPMHLYMLRRSSAYSGDSASAAAGALGQDRRHCQCLQPSPKGAEDKPRAKPGGQWRPSLQPSQEGAEDKPSGKLGGNVYALKTVPIPTQHYLTRRNNTYRLTSVY